MNVEGGANCRSLRSVVACVLWIECMWLLQYIERKIYYVSVLLSKCPVGNLGFELIRYVNAHHNEAQCLCE